MTAFQILLHNLRVKTDPPRTIPCKHCGVLFIKSNPAQVFCSPDCKREGQRLAKIAKKKHDQH